MLEFSNPVHQKKIDELLVSHNKFWVNTFAVYHELNGEHHLKVKDLYEIFNDQSCHLDDFLEHLEELKNYSHKKIESELPLSI